MRATYPGVATMEQVTPALVAAGALASCVMVRLVDPNEPGFYPTCPFLALTGRWCPGCGSLRGLHALLRGDVAAAAGLNILLVLALPFLVYAWVVWALRSWTSRTPPSLRLSTTGSWVLVAVIMAFWVVRNLPWAPAAALAP